MSVKGRVHLLDVKTANEGGNTMSTIRKLNLLEEEADNSRARELSNDFYNQIMNWSAADHRKNAEVEKVIVQQKIHEIFLLEQGPPEPQTLPSFSPSGASSCPRELYYKLTKHKPEETRYPYQNRWTRNSNAVHDAVQGDLLGQTLLTINPAFKVKFLDNGLPMWEENIKTNKQFTHNGQTFLIGGMMDGVLQYKDGSTIGFEFKTKTNSPGQVGHYKMKAPAPYHLEQCTAYSLLFGMDEFIVMYEAICKDGWTKGAEAKQDVRVFYHKVTEGERLALLDKFADITRAITEQSIPEANLDKCLFCKFSQLCAKEEE